MSTLDVVAEVLREVAPRALKAREIAARAGDRLPTASRTPETVVSRDLALDVKARGPLGRFLRADRGAFLLKEALPTAFYNDTEAYAAAWTRNLITAGEIAEGVVDERSIRDLSPADVASYRQCHFFSGIGVWSRALRDAGWPDDVNVWTGSCPCFPAGTLILTQRGNIPIEDVQVGDVVLTHRARWRRVQAVGSDNGRCVQLKGQGHWGLICTPEHPFLSGDEEWTAADQMAGKRWSTIAHVPAFMGIPPLETNRGAFYDKYSKGFRATGERAGKSVYLGLYQTKAEAQEARNAAVRDGRIDVKGADAVDTATLEFARFIGYWVGDGWTTGDSVCICGAKGDGDFLRRLMESAGLTCSLSQERTGPRARCGSKTLVAWLRLHFGQGAAFKRIPAWLHGARAEYRQAFLSGYFAADGHHSRNAGSGAPMLVFTTVSRALAVGTRILLNQAGISASIARTHSRGGKTVIEGRTVNERPMFRVTAYDKARSFDFCGPHGRGLVRTVIDAGEARVYNIAVEEDESYCADGIAVHNCQPLSQAGRRRGFADERHLWPEWFRLIAACRPAVVLGEQVSSKDGLAWLDLVYADLEGAGYTVQAIDTPAASVGAPHARHRIYFVAYARGRAGEIVGGAWLRARAARAVADSREGGRAVLGAARLHDQGESGHDAPGCGSVDDRATGAVSDAPSTRPCLPQDAGADRGDAIPSSEALGRRAAGNLQSQRGGAPDAAGTVSDAECIVRDAGRIGGSHGRQEIESDRHGEVDGAVSAADGSDGLGDAGFARGRRHAGTVRQAEGVGAGAGVEAGTVADEPLTASPADGSAAAAVVRGTTGVAGAESGFQPGDRIRIDGDPSWGGAVRGYWAADVEWIYCRPEPGHQDGRWRPAQSGTQPLVNWPALGMGRTRAKRLKGYGNAIVLPLATAFVASVIDSFGDVAVRIFGDDAPVDQAEDTGDVGTAEAAGGRVMGDHAA